jgi:hypothetical protein
MDSNPASTASKGRWWEQLPPTEGLILPKALSPWILVELDNDEAVKSTPSPR